MKYWFILFFMFAAFSSGAQSLSQVQTLLQSHDFAALRHYLKNDSFNSNYVRRPVWKILHSLTGGYWQAVVVFHNNKGPGDAGSFQVKLLTAGNQILYYQVAGIKNYVETTNNRWVQEDSLVSQYSNDTAFNRFTEAYRQAYGQAVKESELFVTLIYGSYCGIAGIKTYGRDQLDYFVENRHADSLRQWLRSPVAEKQLFAIQGFRVLQKLYGYRHDTADLKIIQLIRNKEGFVNTCNGCVYGSVPFRQELRQLETTPVKYLLPESMRRPFKKQGTGARIKLQRPPGTGERKG